jgi:hypothetical protein
MNMNTQQTPETDDHHARFPMGGFTLDFARWLERERDEARKNAETSKANKRVLKDENKRLRSRVEKLECQLAAAQDELIRLTDTKRPSRETSNKLDLTP